MLSVADNYEIYYADKLWNLLPAVYRTLDTDMYNTNGPLRELVNRIGAQAAVARRSIDRLWEDQSIESCDDWVISYIGSLLATNLVSSLDARGQRLDVYNTIYYRRRKGTVAVLEEIAYDMTGWNSRCVEFFRRLARTRHSLDPVLRIPGDSVADNDTLKTAQGLTGTWTGSMIGGWADLRNFYGASHAQGPDVVSAKAQLPSAFDEYFHTADARAGNGRSGWYNIAKLGVFLWRLQSFLVNQSTPVQNGDCYTFDPTGRRIPLFAAASRPLGDTWISPSEWQLPTPISTPLLKTSIANPDTVELYAALDSDGVTLQANSLGVFTKPGSFYELIDVSRIAALGEPPAPAQQVLIIPESGLFEVLQPLDGPVTVSYNYGFSAPMGAGSYDRRIIGQTPAPMPLPTTNVNGGGNALETLDSAAAVGTISINDSLTYSGVANLSNIQQLSIVAQNQTRPVIRFTPAPQGSIAEWIINGTSGGSLVLDGLLFSGGDVVLTGTFASVTLTCCTFDPGNVAGDSVGTAGSQSSHSLFAQSIDGRDLVPTRFWIEGEVTQLVIDRCILGPVRIRNNGEVESLTMTNSIVQAISLCPTDPSPAVPLQPDSKGLALAFTTGVTNLSRCTILGPAYLHELVASECILDDLVVVENSQSGCIRFTAWSEGSVVPRRYQSVMVQTRAALYTSRAFGQAGFAQLQANADSAILTGAHGATISAGAVDGSEMGAFASLKNPLKVNSLLIKYQEYMPLGLNPILINVT